CGSAAARDPTPFHPCPASTLGPSERAANPKVEARIVFLPVAEREGDPCSDRKVEMVTDAHMEDPLRARRQQRPRRCPEIGEARATGAFAPGGSSLHEN